MTSNPLPIAFPADLASPAQTSTITVLTGASADEEVVESLSAGIGVRLHR